MSDSNDDRGKDPERWPDFRHRPAPVEPAPGRERVRVLVCDDDVLVLGAVGGMLRARGYDPIEVESGQEAVARAADLRPAAILLDLMMPGMSGYETIEALRAQDATRDIPIVVFSALPGQQEKAIRAGAQGWVPKPARTDDILRALDDAIARGRG
jgi:CheY-like chemotaxis protein